MADYSRFIHDSLAGIGRDYEDDQRWRKDYDRQLQLDEYNQGQDAQDWAWKRERAGIEDQQWQKNYDLDLRRQEAADTGSDESWYGSPQWYETGDGLQFGLISNRGNFRPIEPPDGGKWAPRVTYQDTGTQKVPTYQQGGGRAGDPLTVQGNVPPGYQQTPGQNGAPGGIAPMPGSQPAIERGREQTQARGRLNSVETDAENVGRMIDDARKLATGWSTGTGGAFMDAVGVVAPTSRRELINLLDGIKANVSFDKLQQMRDMSPTGGALGQVSDFENRLLQAVRGPLDPMQAEQMLGTLDNIQRRYDQAVVAYRIAYMTDYEGLDRQLADEAIDAIRQGAPPQDVLQEIMAGGGQ